MDYEPLIYTWTSSAFSVHTHVDKLTTAANRMVPDDHSVHSHTVISVPSGFPHLGKREPCTVITAVFKTEPLSRQRTHEGPVKSRSKYNYNDYNNSMQRPKSTDIIIMGSHTPPPDVCSQCGCNDRAERVISNKSWWCCWANLPQWPHTNVQPFNCCKPVPSYHKKQACHIPFIVLFCSWNAFIMYLHHGSSQIFKGEVFFNQLLFNWSFFFFFKASTCLPSQ